MYGESITTLSQGAVKKAELARQNPAGYVVASGLAGIYVGLGILLIFAVGAPFAAAGSPAVKLVMGVSFGVALTLVIFAGSELFTGNAMIMPFGLLERSVRWGDLARVWGLSWLGNLAGSLVLALVAVQAGSLTHAYGFFAKVAAAKMAAPALELFLRGVLCNVLVCLAIWTGTRAKSEAARLVLIFWCLFAFIGSGYEHSIANMTLLAVALVADPANSALGWGGYAWNLLWVTLGNVVGAVLVLVLPYALISRTKPA